MKLLITQEKFGSGIYDVYNEKEAKVSSFENFVLQMIVATHARTSLITHASRT